MLVRPFLAGMIEIDMGPGQTLLWSSPAKRFSADCWRQECPDGAPCAVVAADLLTLEQELETEFRRLQTRLAA